MEKKNLIAVPPRHGNNQYNFCELKKIYMYEENRLVVAKGEGGCVRQGLGVWD